MHDLPIALRGDSLRPADDERSSDSPLVGVMLVAPEGGIGCICPARAVGDKRIFPAGHGFRSGADKPSIARLHGRPDLGLQSIPAQGLEFEAVLLVRIIRPAVSLCAAAIVLQINYQSVLKEPLLLQFVDNPADWY